MKYYFIYSAGGGAGDWNGIKRVWVNDMPVSLKSEVLLKFGDVFFNHASLSKILKTTNWRTISNVRKWLFDNVKDNYVNTNTKILLDSGTSKIVNTIKTANPTHSPIQVVQDFDRLIRSHNILKKYVDVIVASNIDEAVTFDIPNPFKIRTQNSATTTNVFNSSSNQLMIATSGNYSNQIYAMLGNSQTKLLTIINGLWSTSEINQFLNTLNYTPTQIAIGGLTRASDVEYFAGLNRVNSILPFARLNRVHLLGCGGLDNATATKAAGYNLGSISVDNSTPFNRAIDGSTSGSTMSGYYDYTSKKLFRINPGSINQILSLHAAAVNPNFTVAQMTNILKGIIQHQSGNSSQATYDDRARLVIHNHDVYRVNAL